MTERFSKVPRYVRDLSGASNPICTNRTKHIDVRCYYVRKKVDSKFYNVVHMSSADQNADGLTKNLPAEALMKHRRTLLNEYAWWSSSCLEWALLYVWCTRQGRCHVVWLTYHCRFGYCRPSKKGLREPLSVIDSVGK